MTTLHRLVALVALCVAASACTSTNVVGTDTASGGPDLLAFEEVAMATPEPWARPTPTPLPTPTSAPVYRTVTVEPVATPTTVATPTPRPGATTPPPVNTADRFVVGRCYRTASWQAGEAIPCTESHRAEVVISGVFDRGPDAAYIDDDEAFRVIDVACVEAMTNLRLTDYGGIGQVATWATPDQWRQGDRTWSCFARFDEPVTRTLAQIAAVQQGDRAEERAREQALAEEQRLEARRQQVVEGIPQVGDCIANSLRAPCDGNHEGIVFASGIVPSANDEYPSHVLFDETMRDFCIGEADAQGVDSAIRGLYPNREEWGYGIRSFVCVRDLN